MARNGSGTFVLSDTIAPATLADANELQAILDDIAATLTLSVASDGQTVITGALQGADGTASLPGYSFSADLNSGFYRIGADNMGISAAATKIWDWSAVQNVSMVQFQSNGLLTAALGIAVSAGVITNAVGAVGAPSYTFTGDLDCGMYRIGANNLGIAVNGAKVLDIATTGLGVTGALSATTSITGATAAGAMVATQAEQETAAAVDKLITPGRQQFHPSACKAWVRFQGADGAINASYNVSSVTRNGTGDYTVLFDTDMSTANYCGVAICSGVGGVGMNPVMDITAAGADAAPSSAGQRFSTFAISTPHAAADPTRVYYAAFGDQA